MRDLMAELVTLANAVRQCQDTHKLIRSDGSIVAYAIDYSKGLSLWQHIAGEISDFHKDKGNLGTQYGHLLEAALHLVHATGTADQHHQFRRTETELGAKLLADLERNFDQHAALVRKALAAIEG